MKLLEESCDLTPNVGRVSLLLFHLFHVGVGVLLAHAPMGLAHFDDQIPDVLGHHFCITANVEMCHLLSDQVPQRLRGLPHLVRDVNLLGAVSRECGVQSQDPVFGVLLQLLFVDVILVLVSTAEV